MRKRAFSAKGEIKIHGNRYFFLPRAREKGMVYGAGVLEPFIQRNSLSVFVFIAGNSLTLVILVFLQFFVCFTSQNYRQRQNVPEKKNEFIFWNRQTT